MKATSALIIDDVHSTDMIKGKILKLMKDEDLKKAATGYLMDVASNEHIYKQVLEKVLMAVKDRELKAAASDYIQQMVADEKLQTKAITFVQEISADQKIQKNIIKTLTVAAKQSLKQNCPRLVGGTAAVGVGTAIAGLYVMKNFCAHSTVSDDNEESLGVKATDSLKEAPEI